VTDVLENIEGGILRCKGEERSLSQQTLILDCLVTIRDSFNDSCGSKHVAINCKHNCYLLLFWLKSM
jgi:hypothetical protein